MHEETLDIVEFHEVGKNFLEVLHNLLIVMVLYEVGMLYLQVRSNLVHCRYLHEVVRKLPPGFCAFFEQTRRLEILLSIAY